MIKLFVRSDIDGFFGLFIDNLVNLLVISFTLIGFGMPKEIVFGKVIPGAALSLIFGNFLYTYLGYRLAKKENRTDVTALPYGISTPIMFAYLFLIIGPVYHQTKDPILAWRIGVASAFIGGIVEISGAFIGEQVRKMTPRAALLGTLAGIAITWISMKPAGGIFAHPVIGFLPLAVILLGFIAKVVFPLSIPTGLLAILMGSVAAWLTGFVDIQKISFRPQFHLPIPVLNDILYGIKDITPYLTIILPFGIYNFLETMQNVESAAAAGDKYNTRVTMLIDGLGTVVGSIFGSCFPTTVYIGHPGWKSVGAGIGYSALNGIVITMIAITGLMGFISGVIPKEVAFCILLYIGLVITSQAFTSVPAEHAPAVAIAFIPHISNFTFSNLDLAVKNITNFTNETIATLEKIGVEYTSFDILSRGAIVTGMMLGAITAFLVNKDFKKASIYSITAAIMSFFGVIHSDKMYWSARPYHAFGYLMLTILFIIVEKLRKK